MFERGSTAECVRCGKPFRVWRSGTRFCSQDCQQDAWRKRKPKVNAFVLPCVGCGVEIRTSDARKKFCSKDCRYRHFNNARPTTKEQQRECPVCGQKFVPMQARGVGKTFCSPKCRRKANYDKNKAMRSSRQWEWKKTAKWGGNWFAAMERDKFTCQGCGLQRYPSQWHKTGTSKLVVHHLDGSGEREVQDHSLDNLLTLCPTCHHHYHRIFLVKIAGEWRVRGTILDMLGISEIKTVPQIK